MSIKPTGGAPLAVWDHFDLVLGLKDDLLPIVHDENTKPAANTIVKRPHRATLRG